MAGFRIADKSFVAIFLILQFNIPVADAGPVSVSRMGSDEDTPVWYRLENNELRVDFSSENSFRIDSFHLLREEADLAGQSNGSPLFWEDRINGEEVESASAVLLKGRDSDDNAGLEVFGAPNEAGASSIRLGKTVRLFAEGAQLEIGYTVTNRGSETLPVAYSVQLPWKVADESKTVEYHLPGSGAIRKVGFEELAGSVQLDGLEFTEPWFGATSAENDFSCLFASDQPLVSWTANKESDSEPSVEAIVWEGTLKPGETREGTCWVAAVTGLGSPVSVSGHYAAGVAWKPGYRFDSYCLESRVVGMPRGLKKFRLFSGLRRTSSSVALVPVYTRRSKLSPTAVYSIPMPGSFEARTCYLEQSIYSSSENVGYWNIAVTPPGGNAPQVATTPSGPMTSVSYFIPPQNPGEAAKAVDYHSSLPHLAAESSQPEDPSADEIALLEWPNWENPYKSASKD
jgi:hypothetical protein